MNEDEPEMTGLSLEIANRRLIRPLAANFDSTAKMKRRCACLKYDRPDQRRSDRRSGTLSCDFPHQRANSDQPWSDALIAARPLITGEITQAGDASARSVFTFLYRHASRHDHIRRGVAFSSRQEHVLSAREWPERRRVASDGKTEEKTEGRDGLGLATLLPTFKRRGAVAGNTRYAPKRLRFERCIIIDSVYSRAPCV